jgi:hypothetical protein
MTHRTFNVYISEIESRGCKVLGFRKGKHMVAKCVTPKGVAFSIPMSSSPSDWRALRNFRKQVKHYVETQKGY